MVRSVMWRVGALTAIVLLLSGCGPPPPPPPPPYTELSEPQTDRDGMPNGLPDGAKVDAESLRYVGEYDDVTFYLARSTDPLMPYGVCFLYDAPKVENDGGGTGCGTHGVIAAWDWGSARYSGPAAIPNAEIEDGWVRISDNLIYRPQP